VEDPCGRPGLPLARCAVRDEALRAILQPEDLSFLREMGEWMVRVGRPAGADLLRALETFEAHV